MRGLRLAAPAFSSDSYASLTRNMVANSKEASQRIALFAKVWDETPVAPGA